MSKAKEYPFKQRTIVKETIKCILQVIKDNKNIIAKELLAKLHVNPPFLTAIKALDYLEDLKRDGKIKINKNNEVSLFRAS